jgi:hypothetical protein
MPYIVFCFVFEISLMLKVRMATRAKAAARYGSGSNKMMQLLAAPTPQD